MMVGLKKKVWALWLALPLCLGFSLFLTNNTFAETTDVVCKSLVAESDTAGWDSPAVTVCAGRNDGKVILVSLGLSKDYANAGANTSGISSSAKIDVKDKHQGGKRGVIFYGNSGESIIDVGGLKNGQRTLGGSFKAEDYSDPGAYVDAVLNAGKGVIGDDKLYTTRTVGASGGKTLSKPKCTAAKKGDCGPVKEDDVRRGGYDGSVSECEWTKQSYSQSSDARTALYDFLIVCGATPAHEETVNYYIKIKNESKEVAEEANSAATGETEEGEDGEESEEQNCDNSAGAMSMGWIVCRVMEFLGDASGDIYDKYLEPSLQVDPQLFEGGNEGVKAGWETFRTIANTFFIILFLAVIFSQLTGVGIDNYGIKKILPKMIVAAILINLSYWLCLIFIDLSNILGNSFQALFEGLGEGLNPTLDITDFEGGGGTIAESKIVAVGVIVTLVTAVGVGWANPAIVLSLLVSALSIAISVLFLFILLTVREAAIIVLTVLAPIAIVSYMLPNTKKFFDKWQKFFIGLLLVYPICGLLIGGGNYVSNLLLSAGMGGDGFLAAFAAMIVGIVPIFLIPTVLKNSFAAMGNMGAKLSGLGQRASGWTSNKVRKSEGFKNAQQMGLERRTRKKAGIDREGQLTRVGRVKNRAAQTWGGKLIGANKRLNAYTMAAQKDIATGEEANAAQMAALSVAGIDNAEGIEGLEDNKAFGAETKGAYYGNKFLDAAGKGKITEMNAALQAMKASGMRNKDIAELMRFAINKDMINIGDSGAKRDWFSKIAGQYGDVMSTDYELNNFLQTGGQGELGNYGDRFNSEFIQSTDLKPEDFIAMSGKSMAAAIATGKYTQGLAKQVQARNPNMSEDKSIMTGATASGSINQDRIKEVGHQKFGEDLKKEAEKIAGEHANIATSTTINATTKDVDNWTAPAPMRVENVTPSQPAQNP